MKKILHDRQFAAALLAAPLFVAFFWWVAPPVDFRPGWTLRSLGRLLLLAMVYPVLEETVFRGLIQGSLYRYPFGARTNRGVSVANVLTSVLFAAAHLFYSAPLWAMLIFFPSLVFGYFRDRYQSIVPAMVLHIVYNGCFFWVYPL